MDPGSIDLMMPEVSIIPPFQNEGCFLHLYFNGELLEDTFIVFKDRPGLSIRNKWKIFRSDKRYSRDHYEIYHSVYNGKNFQQFPLF